VRSTLVSLVTTTLTEISDLLRKREAAEIVRSRAQAQKTKFAPCEIDRYLSPAADSAFALEYAFHLMGDVAGKRVLDLGCGDGETVVVLAHKGAQVVALDISPELIDLARRRVQMQCDGLPTPELFVRTAYDTGVDNASVDLVLSKMVFHHLDLSSALKEIRRVLKPNGRLIFNEPVQLPGAFVVARRLFPKRGEISNYEHPLTCKEYRMIGAFFNIEQQRAFRLPFVSLAIRLRIPERRMRWIYSLDCWLLKRFAFLWPLAATRVAAFTPK